MVGEPLRNMNCPFSRVSNELDARFIRELPQVIEADVPLSRDYSFSTWDNLNEATPPWLTSVQIPEFEARQVWSIHMLHG